VVTEQELAVLIVRTSRTRLDVNLVVVVFPGILIQTTEFKSVIALDPGKAVGEIVDRACRVRGVRAAAQSREGGHIHAGNTVLDFFAGWKNIRVIEADRSAIKKMRLIHRDVDLVLTI